MDQLSFALLSALLLAVGDSGKKVVAQRSSAAEAAFVICALGAAWLTAPGLLALAAHEWSRTDIAVIVPFVLSVAILAVTEILFTEAIRAGDISVSLPFLSFIPVFAALAGYVFLGETMTPAAALGVGLVIVGGWWLLATPGRLSLGAAFAHRPTRLIVFCTLLAGIGSVPYKLGSAALSPLLFYWLVLIGETLLLFLFCRSRGLVAFHVVRGMPLGIAGLSLVWAAGMACYFVALEGSQVAYAAAVQRVHGLFGILIGWLVFREREIGRRIAAGAVMLLGVACVLLTR